MRISISRAIAERHHALIELLIHEGFRGVGHAGVEIHVKAKGIGRWQALERKHWKRNGGRHTSSTYEEAMARARGQDERHASQFTGYAYRGVPGVANVAKTTRVLVTLTIPPDPEALTLYPRTWQYPRMKTGPVVEFANWREEMLHLAAHEANHVWQQRTRGGRQSEIRAEKWAEKRLAEFRATFGAAS